MRIISKFLIPFLILLLSGCAYQMASERDRLQASGRYGDLERHLESDRIPLADMQTQKLFPLCISYSKLKKYNKLFPCIEHLEDNIRNGDKFDIAGPRGFEVKSDITPMPHLLSAEAYLELGEYQKAIVHANEANQPFPDENSLGYYSEFAIRKDAITILALAHAFSGNKAGAKTYLKQLDDLNLGGFIGIAVRSKEKKKALAKIYMALGEYKKSLEYLKSGIFGGLAALTDVVIGASAQQRSIWTYLELPTKFMRNKCLLETGKLKEAKAGFDALLKVPQTQDNGEIYWLILFDRGRIAEREGNANEAIDYYKKAVAVIEQQRSTINTEASKIGFVGNKQEVYYRLISALFSNQQYSLAFEYVERSKSRTLVDLLAGKQDFVVKRGNIQQVRALLAMAESSEREAQTQDVTPEKYSSRGLAIKSKQQIREQAPELASLISVTQTSTTRIQGLLPADEVLVEYYYFNNDIFVFILDRQNIGAVKMSTALLTNSIIQFRQAIQDPQTNHFLELSQNCYNSLFKPIESHINKSKLIIIPHGVLHYLPFNCLYDGKEYFIDRFSIRIAPSASVLEYLKETKPIKSSGLLVLGNPDLGDTRYDLMYAQVEALTVAKTRPFSKVLLRKEATETSVKQFSSDFACIHFATHGEFNPDSPLNSALFLAKDGENDGMLTVGEVYSLQFSVDLVTLSACETGLGKIASGDEVVGLTRGFLYAGSTSIVASLWKVNDLATSYLMTRFYSELKKRNKREALRQAQIDTRKKYSHPFFWAAFQLTGNAR